MSKIRDTFQRPPSGWRVTDPLTNVMFEANSFRNLRGKIITHRRANNIVDLNVDDFITEQICGRNPPEFCEEWPKTVQYTPASVLKFTGPQLWADLHRHALAFKYEGRDDWGWLNAWADQIPKQGCSCRDDWKAYLKKTPPDWSNFFAWSVAFHNSVNDRLGKMTYTEQQARSLWQSPTI